MNGQKTTVAKYLIGRLYELGVKHIFGVPGDYVLDFLDRIVESPIKFIGACNELNAGYAADGYARQNGLGAVVVTYGVGGFSALNAIVGAYAEQIPVVLISGAPSSFQRRSKALVHHLTNDYNLQFDIFRKATVDSAMLMNPHSAPILIDRVLRSCIMNSRPVYLEIPTDCVDAECQRNDIFDIEQNRTPSDAHALEECVEEAVKMLDNAKNPIILAGVELHRFKIAEKTLRLVERSELPFATTLSSKSVLPELHPQFIGVYQGAFSRPEVRQQIENSDAILSLGVWMTDLNTGIFTAKLPEEKMININSEYTRIRHHYYRNIWLGDFIEKLADHIRPRQYLSSHPATRHVFPRNSQPTSGKAISVAKFYEMLNSFIDDSMIVVAETGDAICASGDLFVQEASNFIAQAYYLSIGYGLPASLGMALARPDKRPLVLEGDGAFQMTVQELSTLLRYDCHPVIFLLNNEGYVIERLIHDGPYNNIQNWKYHKLPEVFAEEKLFISLEVKTEDDLANTFKIIDENKDKLIFVEVHFSRTDCSEMLLKLGSGIRKLSAE